MVNSFSLNIIHNTYDDSWIIEKGNGSKRDPEYIDMNIIKYGSDNDITLYITDFSDTYFTFEDILTMLEVL